MTKLITITLAIFAVATMGQAMYLDTMPMVEYDLANLLLSSSFAMQRDPELTVKCFDTYKPKIEACAEDYKNKLNACHQTSASAKDKINADVAPHVDKINAWHSDICGSYNSCQNGDSDPVSFFQCNNVAAEGAISTSYNIQTLSKDQMTYVSRQLEAVKYDETKCNDDCEDAYKRTSGVLYQDLQDCMSGKIPLPEPEETTEPQPETPEPEPETPQPEA